MSDYDDELIARAVEMYLKSHERQGTTPVRPSRTGSGREGKNVYLRSGGKTLAWFVLEDCGELALVTPFMPGYRDLYGAKRSVVS